VFVGAWRRFIILDEHPLPLRMPVSSPWARQFDLVRRALVFPDLASESGGGLLAFGKRVKPWVHSSRNTANRILTKPWAFSRVKLMTCHQAIEPGGSGTLRGSRRFVGRGFQTKTGACRAR